MGPPCIPQAIMKRFPNLFTWGEMNALSNFRGVPNAINSEFHLSLLNRLWNNFYRNYPRRNQGHDPGLRQSY